MKGVVIKIFDDADDGGLPAPHGKGSAYGILIAYYMGGFLIQDIPDGVGSHILSEIIPLQYLYVHGLCKIVRHFVVAKSRF